MKHAIPLSAAVLVLGRWVRSLACRKYGMSQDEKDLAKMMDTTEANFLLQVRVD